MFVEDTTESRLGQNPADPFPLCSMGVLHLSLSVGSPLATGDSTY